MTFFKKLSAQYRTPKQVQKLLRSLSYNSEKGGETVRSALATWNKQSAHCLEGALLAAAILEHRGFPPIVMSLESKDDLDHVVFIFNENGKWGSVGRSRMEGLHGRAPIFKTVRDLADSYFDPFIDKTGRVTGYGYTNLDESKSNWRFSKRNVWKVEDFLIELKHANLKSSEARYQKWYKYFLRTGESGIKQNHWW